MAGQIKESTDASIRLDGADCGGVLKVETDYRPILSGIPLNPFLAGVYVNTCMDGETAPNVLYVIDVTDASFNPFPGANFTQGALIWDGTASFGPALHSHVCSSRSSGLRFVPDPPYAIPSPPVLRFSKSSSLPAEVTIRLAWTHGPQYGLNVIENCTYTVSA